jgi:hypothetical protein
MRRTAAALAVTMSLMTTAPSGMLDQLWAVFSFLWADSTPKIGCGMDPDGLCQSAPAVEETTPPPTGEIGCGMDPNGTPKCS